MTRSSFVIASLVCLPGCYSTVDHGRPPASVDTTRPPDDARRRTEPPPPEAQAETRHEVTLVQAPRVGGRKAGDEHTTWAFGGDVSAWYLGSTSAGVRASGTYVRERGVTDATFGPALGFPVLGNLGVAWAYDPQKRLHGGQASVELGGAYLKYVRYGGADGEGRIEFGILIPLGIQSFSWYR